MMIRDFRSDTVTKPSQAMLDAMMSAKVGDDVYGEDPTVNELEHYLADIFGMEAAIFCPSGTMTNQIALKLHTHPGDEIICDQTAHIYNYEGGGIGFNSGCSVKLIAGQRGVVNLQQVQQAVNDPDNIHLAYSRLVSLENTANKAGGSIYTLKDVEPIRQYCTERGLKLHLDGARLFNALIETGESYKDWGENFDTISICLSKGLGTPMGSLLLGNATDIKWCKRIRKLMGGGMRQAGYIAAAGLFALNHNIDRLKLDNNAAKWIGAELENFDHIVEIKPVESNIIIFKVETELAANQVVIDLRSKGILISSFGGSYLRAVTHMDVNQDDCVALVSALSA
ncbi:MAG: GntG family PLP-dependent aldolase [Bacteroidota bacterium]|nr:GntG family PLP-dependent aldolase [Bacteroidota bacterium]